MAQKGLIDQNLEALLKHLANLKKEAYDQRTKNEAVPTMRPELLSWDGGVQTEGDLIALHKPFNTDEAENALLDAYNAGSPGNVSDGILLSLQIDYAAQAERAYRSRATHTFPRTVAHVSTREKGHGQENGALLGQALKYFTAILKQGAEG
jgi:hypothetical protein